MKEFLRPRMNLPMILLVFFSFALIDQWIVPAVVAHKVTATSEYRIPINFTYGQLKVFIDQINEDPAPKIILTGDSIIQGGGVGSGKESIASYLQHELESAGSPYRVYNLGISGAAPADMYFVIKALKLTNRDIVVYDLNVGHYGKGNKALTFPKITAELSWKYDQGESLYDDLSLQTDKLEDGLQLLVTNTWKFYAYREVIKSIYQEKYYGYVQKQPEVDLRPWHEQDWTEKTKNAAKRGAIELTDKDVNVKFLKRLIETAREGGARVLVFNVPLNQDMMAQYQMIDRARFDENVDALSDHAIQAGASYQDYERLIPSPYFIDSLHPMSKGNELIAKRLHQDLQAWLDGKEVSP